MKHPVAIVAGVGTRSELAVTSSRTSGARGMRTMRSSKLA